VRLLPLNFLQRVWLRNSAPTGMMSCAICQSCPTLCTTYWIVNITLVTCKKMPLNVWMWSNLKHIYKFRHLLTEDQCIIHCGSWYDAKCIREFTPLSKYHNTNTYMVHKSRASLIIWCPFQPIFSKHFQSMTGLVNLFEGVCRKLSETFFYMWKPGFNSTIFPIIPVTF
jgi:hypothetical protein